MVQAKEGDTVKVHYTGSLVDGTTFDSTEGREPFEFTIGQEMVIPAFERAVIGMEVGDEKSITIPAAEAYGESNPEMISVVDKRQLPEGLIPEIGMMLQASTDNGSVINIRIVEIGDDTITVDANHPLAGKELNFKIKLVEIC